MVAKLCVVLSGLLVASLCGCGGGSQATSPPDASTVAGGSGGLGGTGGGGTGGQLSTATSAAPFCIPGASVACACVTGQTGAQTCTSAGTFGACVCATTSPSDAAAVGGSGGPVVDATVDQSADVPVAPGPFQDAAVDAGEGEDASGTTPAIISFTASPVTIAAGKSSTLSWIVTGATMLTLDQGVAGSGLVSVLGTTSQVVTPTQTTTYTLTLNGSVSAQVTVTVVSPCGDGIVADGKQCDDGNTVSGDGCSSTCQKEPGADCPTPGQLCNVAKCGNGIKETGEQCDCGNDPTTLPTGCKGQNGLFSGDPNNPGCSKTCTKEPKCIDSTGKTQACSTACGDGNIDPGEACDDGNQLDGDGCSSKCTTETGFVCTPTTHVDSSPCSTDQTSQCLELPVIYRDFQPENVASGGHPDFFFLGTKAAGSTAPTTICVPNSGGPAKGNDSTARCWDIAAPNLSYGKPQYNSSRLNNQCACQFSDWNIGNSGAHIPGTYTQTGNDSPLSDGAAGYRGGTAGTAISFTNPSGQVTGILKGYTASTPGGPIFNGVVPIVKNAASFKQWFNDDTTVNKTFLGVLEMKSIGTNIYQYASKTHLSGPDNGFYPLDTLNPSQATLCDLWPYWNHGNGTPIWATCQGDQYFYPPRIIQSDCPNQNPLSAGCWITATPGVKHDSYFTDEARYFFVYSQTTGISLQFFGDDDLFVYINGILVLDLGGVHQQLPGKVSVTGAPGATQATISEGGCLDATGNITTTAAGYTAAGCAPAGAPAPISPDDYRTRNVNLNLEDGKVYEIAIFGANRHALDSNYQITLSGYTTKRSICQPI